MQSLLLDKRQQEIIRLKNTYGAKADVAQAVQAAAMWTYIYTPAENG